MKEIRQEILTGERALYGKSGLLISETVFEDGESPLKECSDITLENTLFRWKYPLWYCRNVNVKGCSWYTNARAGVWYTENINIEDSMIEAPKNFRRCTNITIKNSDFSDAAETLWHCKGVKLDRVGAKGDYFAMNSEDLDINELHLFGNYSFDGCKNVTVRNSRLLTKDSFWNSENVTVYDSFISGEYLGWNSKKLTLVNCTIESLQGLCYIDELTMINCRLIDTTLAFEFSSVSADISTGITSILNPKSGTITAQSIGELIIEKDRVGGAVIKCTDIKKQSDRPEWIKE